MPSPTLLAVVPPASALSRHWSEAGFSVSLAYGRRLLNGRKWFVDVVQVAHDQDHPAPQEQVVGP